MSLNMVPELYRWRSNIFRPTRGNTATSFDTIRTENSVLLLRVGAALALHEEVRGTNVAMRQVRAPLHPSVRARAVMRPGLGGSESKPGLLPRWTHGSLDGIFHPSAV